AIEAGETIDEGDAISISTLWLRSLPNARAAPHPLRAYFQGETPPRGGARRPPARPLRNPRHGCVAGREETLAVLKLRRSQRRAPGTSASVSTRTSTQPRRANRRCGR